MSLSQTQTEFKVATRSFISTWQQDGTLRGIYCHYDGYPSHVGSILTAFYDDAGSADMLINGSQLRSFDVDGSFQRYSTAYDNDSEVYGSVKDVLESGFDYCYIWANGVWECWGRDSAVYPRIIKQFDIPEYEI